jgi:hypothetical protein
LPSPGVLAREDDLDQSALPPGSRTVAQTEEIPVAIMKAAIFVEPGRIVIDDKPIPDIGSLDALVRITTTTICGTDVHILKGEYPVAKGMTVGHEPVGIRAARASENAD